MDNTLETLNQICNDEDLKEGFSPELINIIDLNIEYSPVIAIRGEGLNDAVEAVKTMGENYIVNHSLIANPVTPDSLKRMRLRYLLLYKEKQARNINRMFGKNR